MDYPLESLNPESFQQLCQALLARELPNVQCFPVGQADGGRDATSYLRNRENLDFAMYQVKFSRKPLAEADTHKWLISVLESEAPKIAAQIAKGAKGFYLLTNVPGTAFPSAGSMDRATALLEKHVGIPSQVWWRDDINRRLDSAWDLKWSYPEIMTGPDLIRALIETGLTEEKERRSSAIRAFLSDQYSRDEEVKFKQVELQNRLLDLFIDVPVFASESETPRRHTLAGLIHAVGRRMGAEAVVHQDWESGRWHEQLGVGTADFLLHPLTQFHAPLLVLEGAPGQGKSTIAQYVAQVHRMRLLEKTADLNQIPPSHTSSPVRLPFKIDLRDLATWLAKQNPFSSDPSTEPPAGWARSLESFLAALVRHHSGGAEFSVSDFHAVAKHSAVFLIFDGLDEVADIERRGEVVDVIDRDTRRLKDLTASLQVLVTTRPAAFANSPGLPEARFPCIQLGLVTKKLIDDYAAKWTRARRLQAKEQSEIKRLLAEKLDQPHLRDLARNTMQLAILLSLIHRRGSSLPDKRTALYDSYVELFFSREAEKSAVIREYRDLIIDIHRFVAWKLHCDAETKNSRGSIRAGDLAKLVSHYLEEEGHDPSIAGELFTGMVERVVALVSRVEGTFEFEVQPLREYFAARYLYETAPYSPPGNEQRGTKPDRFDALARDFYWLNVARFYAGCFSKGELPSLVDRLQELKTAPRFSRLSHPRILAATLLSDWVFAQHPRSMKDVVALVLDGIGLRFVVSSAQRRVHGGTPLQLPRRSGREELIERCLTVLETEPPQDYSQDLVDVLTANAEPLELQAFWRQRVLARSASSRTTWMRFGVRLGTLQRCSSADIDALMSDDDAERAERLRILLEGRLWAYLESTADYHRAAVNEILNEGYTLHHSRNQPSSLLEAFASAANPLRYGLALLAPEPVPLSAVWEKNALLRTIEVREDLQRQTVLQEHCYEFTTVAQQNSKLFARDWATQLQPWEAIVDALLKIDQDSWLAVQIANMAAGIRSSAETCREFPSLFDSKQSLCRRVRYARLRSGDVNWWRDTLGGARSDIQRITVLLVFFTWSTNRTLVELREDVCTLVESLPEHLWGRFYRSFKQWHQVNSARRSKDRLLSADESTTLLQPSPRFATTIAHRAEEDVLEEFYEQSLGHYRGYDPLILGACQKAAMTQILNGNANQTHLDTVERCYELGVDSGAVEFGNVLRRNVEKPLELELAERICDRPDKFPGGLVAFAERACHAEVAQSVVPVAKAAADELWRFV
jgi:hypothetical protein